MALTIQETFQVQASASRVWSYLVDPERVVRCLPGAELLEAEDERTFVGRIRVRVGPVTSAFKGRARFEELDEANRLVRMSGSGQEQSGGGSARMTMSSRIVELPDGGCEVRVDVELDIVGKMVQFGRGMIEQVSVQMFQQFADCVRAQLEGDEAGDEAAAAESAGGDAPAPAAEPVNLIPVVLRALRAVLARFLGRPAGR